ncbi:hypothetical protein JJQ59_04830 [Cupriavidus necator]|uniref:hypothetical protein n=1 Tax=Cupriavidus necator TaxID=106590 RepID=UPI001677D319|nr:hypothetical protein [Cupriavidus necator]QQX85269.1 hypothetical protein JJQ59_04830 [Cupriavidus necator]
MLKIIDRQAKLLGLDAPTKSELTGKDGVLCSGAFVLPLALGMDAWGAGAAD